MLGMPPDTFLARCSLLDKFFETAAPAGPAQAGDPACVPPASEQAPAPAQCTNGAASADPAPSGSEPVGAPAVSGWRLKPEATYAREQGVEICRNKQYFRCKLLPDLIARHPPRKPHASAEEAETEAERRRAMLSFLYGLLQYDPAVRWTPRQAIQHPFITGAKYTGRFAASEVAVSPTEGSRPPRAVPGDTQRTVS
eukprot:scaffold17933_cov93-Isochrysis_galbana.AAC.4